MTDDDASWLQSLWESRRPDPGPVVGRWALGIGDMVENAEHRAEQIKSMLASVQAKVDRLR